SRVSACVHDHLHLQAANVALVAVGDVDIERFFAGLAGRHEVLVAVLDIFDGPAENPRESSHGHVFTGGGDLEPERAADVRGADPDLVRWHPEPGGQAVALLTDALIGGPHHEPTRCLVEAGDTTPGLHRHILVAMLGDRRCQDLV